LTLWSYSPSSSSVAGLVVASIGDRTVEGNRIAADSKLVFPMP
jgi:hypothetical protein